MIIISRFKPETAHYVLPIAKGLTTYESNIAYCFPTFPIWVTHNCHWRFKPATDITMNLVNREHFLKNFEEVWSICLKKRIVFCVLVEVCKSCSNGNWNSFTINMQLFSLPNYATLYWGSINKRFNKNYKSFASEFLENLKRNLK